tara:strand:+ start:1555 stop:6066 length:4512 start_codon:yes stop_codon:yes gene_type:complete
MSEEEYTYEEEQVDPQLKLMASYGITASISRFRQTAPSVTDLELNTCMSIVLGVGKESGVGKEVYNNTILGDTGLSALGGFEDVDVFASIASGVDLNYFSSYSSTVRSVYPVITTALIMGAWVAGVDSNRVTGFLNDSFSGASALFGFGPSSNIFSTAQINTILTNNFSGAMASIVNDSAKDTEVKKIYFRTYDLSPSFLSDIDTRRIKDSAVQYYSVSGDLNYDPLIWANESECEEQTIPIFASDNFGIVTDSLSIGPTSANCIDFEKHFKPITGQYFYRKFADNPYSTGTYTSASNTQLQTFDKSLQHESSYSDNIKRLVSLGGSTFGGNHNTVAVTAPQGEYCAAYVREFNERPTDGQTIEMHLGNTGLRNGRTLSGYRASQDSNPSDIFNSLTPVYRNITGVQTGLKFIPISLNPAYWSNSEVASNSMNPAAQQDNVYQNALNFNPNHVRDFIDAKGEDYFESQDGGKIGDVSGTAGPPQRDWISDFPFIVINEDFQSETTEQYAGIRMGFGASCTEVHSNEIKGILNTRVTKQIFHTTGFGSLHDSQEYTSPDEPDQTSVSFGITISGEDLNHSNSGENYIKALCLGMGNGMDSGSLLNEYYVDNAGWGHTGYNYTGVVGVTTTGIDKLGNYMIMTGYSGLATSYYLDGLLQGVPNVNIGVNRGANLSGALVGSRKKTDKMLVGWAHPTYGRVDTTRMYAYSTGGDGIATDEFVFSGFDSGYTADTTSPANVFPIIPADEGFAAMPTGLITGLLGSGWHPVYEEQHRENGFPRYYRGPFASADIKFLYNNARDMYTGHEGYRAVPSKMKNEPNDGDSPFYGMTGERINLPTGQYPNNGFSQPVGFPHRVEFDLVVKEYATKEYWKQRNWNEFSSPSIADFSSEGISASLNEISWSTTNVTTATQDVDSGYATPVAGPLGVNNTWHMGHTGVNPLIYNSIPNYVHGSINDAIGVYSGTLSQASTKEWPDSFRDVTGSYISAWQETLNGSSMGDAKRRNPEGNYTLYSSYTVKVVGYYTPPGWKMRTNTFEPEYAKRVFTGEIQNIWDDGISGDRFGFAGSDPLFYKRVGGFSGSGLIQLSDSRPDAIHGGLHPEGMVGDSWMGFNFDRQPNPSPSSGSPSVDFGYGVDTVNEEYWVYDRAPWRDKEVFITDLRSTGINIYFSALKYFPGSGRVDYSGFADQFDFFKSGISAEFDDIFDIDGKTFSFLGPLHTGSLFRMPSGIDWSGSGSGGNTIYPAVSEWQVDHTGEEKFWRQQSKMELTIENVVWTGHGMLPVDVDYLIQPTGGCTVTGKMAYENLAEQPVYSEGVLLRDTTVGDISMEYGAYPVLISNTLKEHGFSCSTEPNEIIETAPSRQVELGLSGARLISNSTKFNKLNTIEKSYNKYEVISNSDYSYLNRGDQMPSYESGPEADHQIFTEGNMLFSAQQGQVLEGKRNNPNIKKIYSIEEQRQYYDGSVTDASIDDRFTTNIRPVDAYNQPESDYFVPAGLTFNEIKKGWY